MRSFYKGKKVLVTGHTGFKGSWLCIMLLELGAEVIGFSLEESERGGNFERSGLSKRLADIRGDIRNLPALTEVFNAHKPDIVFHLAAQPLVRRSYKDPVETYGTNVMGTLNVLECVRYCEAVRETVVVTTDKCYENKEQLKGYNENDRLGGYDPYSSSKACAELLVSSYRQSYFSDFSDFSDGQKLLATVRAGNVIGGGDCAADRIIPDCMRAIFSNTPIYIRNPNAVRPWQHVIEPLFGYLRLASKMAEAPKKYCTPWNFGPEEDAVVTVYEIVKLVCGHFGYENIAEAKEDNAPHETKTLLLDNTKAKTVLGWTPKLTPCEAVRYTCEWYTDKRDKYDVCKRQIEEVCGGGI